MKRLILTAAVAFGLTLAIVAQGAARQIYFWANVAANMRAPSQPPQPEVIRPSLIFMFADGSWDVDHLSWTGWGSTVARASGISSASNGIPNQAQGRRITRPAQVILSNPGPFFGREVYRCFQLTVPSARQSDQRRCLTNNAGYWFLSVPTPARPRVVEFYAGPPLRYIGCEMDTGGPLNPPVTGQVRCQDQSPNLSQVATVVANGTVHICASPNPGSATCGLGNFGEKTPTFNSGKTVTVGRFTCAILSSGVRCTVTATGRGFLMGPTKTIRVR